MLILNKYQKAKDGTYVMPIAISGDIVQCVDKKGIVVMKNINDFLETTSDDAVEKIIEVSPIEEHNTDFFIDKNKTKMVQYEGELFIEEEDEKVEGVKKEKVVKKSTNRYISDESYI